MRSYLINNKRLVIGSTIKFVLILILKKAILDLINKNKESE